MALPQLCRKVRTLRLGKIGPENILLNLIHVEFLRLTEVLNGMRLLIKKRSEGRKNIVN